MVLTEKQKEYKRRYNHSEKGKENNRRLATEYRADKSHRHSLRMLGWKKRGLQYYPNNLSELYEDDNMICDFCGKNMKRKMMEHNHITGCFRGFTCSSCNTKLGVVDKYFVMLMRELVFVFNLPKVITKQS
tara:strand:- start:236 stop:628 length:393 start_codon:yes stop_codon:yes gene_type:complete